MKVLKFFRYIVLLSLLGSGFYCAAISQTQIDAEYPVDRLLNLAPFLSLIQYFYGTEISLLFADRHAFARQHRGDKTVYLLAMLLVTAFLILSFLHFIPLTRLGLANPALSVVIRYSPYWGVPLSAVAVVYLTKRRVSSSMGA